MLNRLVTLGLLSSFQAITLTQVITDSLTARTARIEDLVFGSMSTDGSMSTRNADIAYHLKIKDEDLEAELQEGDVVGFFTDDHDEGTYVKLLHANDIENAIHAGVVSRSHYIAANKIEGIIHIRSSNNLALALMLFY